LGDFMITRGITILLTLLLSSFLLFTACDVMSDKGIEESLAPYLELESITEGQTTSMNVHRGETMGMDSYFTFEMSNNFTNNLIRRGVKPAWCVEWDKPIAQNGDTHEGIELYSTYGSDKWKPANYLLNSQKKFKKEDQDISYKEIQVALWSVIENPDFDLDKVLNEGNMPARMMKGDQPDFDVQKVKDILKVVKDKYNEYEYKPSRPFLVYTKTEEGTQNGGFLTCDETAWAANGDTPGELRYVNQGNWATYVEYHGVEKTVTLFAGQNINIGTVTFSAPSNGKVTITIDLNDAGDFYEETDHNVKIQDYSVAPSGNPAPGQFDHKGLGTGKSFSIEVPENNYYGVHVDSLAECEEDEDENNDVE
jgi:hypothetical protein